MHHVPNCVMHMLYYVAYAYVHIYCMIQYRHIPSAIPSSLIS